MQMYKIRNADIVVMAEQMMNEMVAKCAHFEYCLQSLAGWRAGRQDLNRQE